MKIQTIKTDVKKSHEFETVNYGVDTQNLPLLFQMLRTNLYSDIYGSIIREICSNVVDAHTEAGKPNEIGEVEWVDANRLLGVDAQLIIRDFGIGLSPERMKTIYGNYLSSTKRDSNDQIGGFGLGSKVPFAYTDSFFVKTIYDGMEYKYLCYIDSSQLGAISLLESGKTSRGNGTEIIIPAKHPYDKERFQTAINKQMMYFTNFRYINFKAPECTVKFEDEHCVVADQNLYPQLHIVLGKVVYPVDFSALELYAYGGYSHCKVGLKFKVGELQPTLSREGLFWNDQVKKLVKAKLARAKESIRKEIEKELANEKDYCKWYCYTQVKKTKTFSDQWHFANISTKAEFITTEGDSLAVRNQLNEWFSGLMIKTVTPFRQTSRRRSTVVSKIPEYVTSTSVGVYDLLDKPIYQYEGTLSARTSLFLFKTHPKGYVVVGVKPSEEGSTPSMYETEALKWMQTLPKYEDIQVTEDEFTNTSDEDYKEAYKKLLAQRKLEGKFTAKTLNYNGTWGSDYTTTLSFSKYEGKFEDQKSLTIIYGTQEQEQDIYKAAALLSANTKYASGKGFTTLRVYKISQANVKQFKLMANAYDVKDVLALKTPLNEDITNMLTAMKLTEEMKQYSLLFKFDKIYNALHKKYVKITDFCNRNWNPKPWADVRDLLTDLGKQHKLQNTEILDEAAEIEEYFKQAQLLFCLTDCEAKSEAVVEYLRFKGLATNLQSEDLIKSK